MEIVEIKKVAEEWRKITWELIEFKNPGLDEVKHLFQNTFEIIKFSFITKFFNIFFSGKSF